MSFIVYGKDACPNCDKAVAMLNMRGQQFVVKKLDKDYQVQELWDVAGEPVRMLPYIVEVDEGSGNLINKIGSVDNLTKRLME